MNSWGDWWDENGTVRVLRGVNECDIESSVVGVWAKLCSTVYFNDSFTKLHRLFQRIEILKNNLRTLTNSNNDEQ